MNDAVVTELVNCFSASPAFARVDVERINEVVNKIRKQQNEYCAQLAEQLAASSRANPHSSFDEKHGAAMACDLLAAIMRGIE